MRRLALLALCLGAVLGVLDRAEAGGIICQAGSAGPNGQEPCTPCDPGTFTPSPGFSVCLQCSIGHFAASSGSTSCQSCEPGSYADEPGAATCTPCAPGYAVDFAGAPACTACGPGYFTSEPGNTSCFLCNAGTYASQSASSSCEPCAAGTFSETLGTIECTACNAGTASSTIGAASSAACVACAVGTFADAPGAASCSACPRNAYQPSTGATTCLSCGCDDQVACTRDACDAIAGTCSAPVVPSCQEQQIEFAGTVTAIDERLFSQVTVGEPFTGVLRYDPEAPDHTPADSGYGDFESALTYVDVLIGSSAPLVVQSSTGKGSVTVQDDGINGDILWFELLDEDGLLGPTFPAVPDALPRSFLLGLRDPSGSALASDALPASPPSFAPFTERSAVLEMTSGTLGSAYVESTNVVVPEPEAALVGAAALGAIAALRRRRVR